MTIYLCDIMNPAELERLVRERYISRVASPDGALVLHNYTAKATYDRVWTPETRACRGIVSVAATGEIVARPFDKFSNVGESGFAESELESLLARPGPVEITEKLDGSMVAVWYFGGDWHCSTRGSFVSSQAQAARRWLGARRFDTWPTGYTLIGEWCAPDNRVVLRYDHSELRLIGARNSSGADLSYTDVAEWASHLMLPVVPKITGSGLAEIIERRTLMIGVEGWVARWPDGYRVKIKTEDYLRLHRLISGFSAARIRDVLLSNSGDRYVQELPEELREEAEHIIAVLRSTAQARVSAITATYMRHRHLLADSRKSYALAVLQEPEADRSFLFSLADGRAIAERVLRDIDLVALFGDRAEAQEVVE